MWMRGLVMQVVNGVPCHWYYDGFTLVEKPDIMRLLDALSLLCAESSNRKLVCNCRQVIEDVFHLSEIGRSI